MTPPVTIRRAVASDAIALARLRYEFRASLGEPVESEAAFIARCAAWMIAQLDRADGWRAWVAVATDVEGMIWSFSIPKIPNPLDEAERHTYISSFYVRSERRGAGIGTALLRQCLADGDANGTDVAFLWPTPASREWYRRNGFSSNDDLMQRRTPDGERLDGN